MRPAPTPPTQSADTDVWDAYAKDMLRWVISNVEHTETRGFSLVCQWETPDNVKRANAFFCLNCSTLHVELLTFVDGEDDLELVMEEHIDPAELR